MIASGYGHYKQYQLNQTLLKDVEHYIGTTNSNALLAMECNDGLTDCVDTLMICADMLVPENEGVWEEL